MKTDLDLLNERLLDVITTINDIKENTPLLDKDHIRLTNLHIAIIAWLEGEK